MSLLVLKARTMKRCQKRDKQYTYCLHSLTISRQTLMQVGDGVALARYRKGVEGHSGRRYGVDTRSMIDKVRVKARRLDVLLTQVACKLIHDSSYHLKVIELLCTPRAPSTCTFYKV